MTAQPDRSREFWQPEPLFAGETVACLGGGPSLTWEQLALVRGRARAIAINSAARAAPWADVLYFTDTNWYEANRELVAAWPGLAVTASRRAKQEMPDRLRRIDQHARAGFDGPGLKSGRSSGHIAISLAIALGASRVLLLGYDMRLVDGRSHFHGEYATQDAKMYATEFIPAFAGWQAAAVAAGVAVLNCTPGSALAEFPAADLADVLGRQAA